MKFKKILAVDYSEDMLQIAKKRFQSNDIENVELMQEDVGNLTLEDESVDVVFSMNGFHAFPDKTSAFRETARVLKKKDFLSAVFT